MGYAGQKILNLMRFIEGFNRSDTVCLDMCKNLVNLALSDMSVESFFEKIVITGGIAKVHLSLIGACQLFCWL